MKCYIAIHMMQCLLKHLLYESGLQVTSNCYQNGDFFFYTEFTWIIYGSKESQQNCKFHYT